MRTALLALATWVASASSAGAQQQRDVVILADVSARSLRFASQPRISVCLRGALDSVRVLDRRNLPETIVAGTTYRDVYVAVAIFGRVEADRIIASLTGDARATPDSAATTRAQRDTVSRQAPADTTRPRSTQPETPRCAQ